MNKKKTENPVYQKVYDELVQKIKDGSEEKLSVNSIAQNYNISRNTAIKIINLMQESGWVKTIRKKGTFPVSQKDKNIYTLNIIFEQNSFNSNYLASFPHVHALIIRGMLESELMKKCALKFFFLNSADSFERRRELLTSIGPKEGLIILDPTGGFEDLIKIIKKERLPYITATSPVFDGNIISHKNYEGALKGMKYMLTSRKKVLFISSDSENFWFKDRCKAYIDAHKQMNMTVDKDLIINFNPCRNDDVQELIHRIKTDKSIDGIFAASFIVGEKIYDMLKILNIKMPDDISLMVFHDTPLLSSSNPGVTVIKPPLEKIGRTIVEEIIKMIDFGYKDDVRILFENELIIRESA